MNIDSKINSLLSEAKRIEEMPQVASEELVSKIEEFFKKSIEVYIGLQKEGIYCPNELMQAFEKLVTLSNKLNLQENKTVKLFHKIVKLGFNLDFQIEHTNVCEFLSPGDLSKIRTLEDPFLTTFGDKYLLSKINEGISLKKLGFSESTLKAFLESHGKKIKCLNLENFNITDISLFDTCENLGTVNFSYCDQKSIRRILKHKNLQKLQKINFTGIQIDYSIASLIAKFKELKHLDLPGTQISYEGLSVIVAGIPGLEKLNISRNKLVAQSIRELRSLINLKELEVQHCNINSAGMGFIGRLSNLEKLDISYNRELRDAGMEILPSLPNLKELDVAGCGITSAGMGFIGRLSNLEKLDISYNRELRDAGMEILPSLSNLKELNVKTCSITSSGMLFIGRLSNLEKLNLSNNDISNMDVEVLKSLTNLKELGMFHCYIDLDSLIDEIEKALPNILIVE